MHLAVVFEGDSKEGDLKKAHCKACFVRSEAEVSPCKPEREEIECVVQQV